MPDLDDTQALSPVVENLMLFTHVYKPDFSKSVACAKSCDLKLMEFLNYPDIQNAYEDLLEQISSFDIPKQIELHNLLQSQAESYEALPLPDGYLEFINDIHFVAWANFCSTPIARELLPKWRERIAPLFIDKNGNKCASAEEWEFWYDPQQQHITANARDILNREGITAKKCFALLNAGSLAVHNAWQKCLGIEATTSPLVFEPGSSSRTTDAGGVQTSKRGTLAFALDERDLAMLDFRWLVHIAFHEPQHAIQKLLSDKALPLDENCIPQKYREAIFQLPPLLEVGAVCPPETFFATQDIDLDNIAYEAYRSSPAEKLAHQQGYLAELAFSEQFEVPLSCETSETICLNLSYYNALPPDLKNRFQINYLFPFIHKSLRPNRPKLLAPPTTNKILIG